MFKKGQKIVCIDDAIKVPMEFHNKHFKNWIKEGKIYTVRGAAQTKMGTGLLLEEVRNPAVFIQDYFGKTEPRFVDTRFAPLQTNEDFVEEVIKQVKEEEVEEPVEA